MENRAGRPAGVRRKFTKELLAPIVAECNSFSEVCRRLGVPAKGNTLTIVSRYANEYALDTSHMKGRAHGTGVWNKRTVAEILTPGRSSREKPERLRAAMIAFGIPYACFGCGNRGEWMGSPLALDIDHINGDEYDNGPQNLRFACPNCHRQTPTWGRV